MSNLFEHCRAGVSKAQAKDTIKPSAMQIYLFLPGGAAVPPRIGVPVRAEKMSAGVNARGRPLRLHTVPCVVAGVPAVRQL